jgi:hypothetical protein
MWGQFCSVEILQLWVFEQILPQSSSHQCTSEILDKQPAAFNKMTTFPQLGFSTEFCTKLGTSLEI